MNETARIAYLGALGIDVWWPQDAFAAPAELLTGVVQSPSPSMQHNPIALPANVPASVAAVLRPDVARTQAPSKTPAAHISELQQSLHHPEPAVVPEFTLQFLCFSGVWLVFSRVQLSAAHAMLVADIARWRGSEVVKPTFMADFVWPYIRDGKIDQSGEQAKRHLGMFMSNLHQQQPAQEILIFSDAAQWLDDGPLAGVTSYVLPVSLQDCLQGSAAKRTLFNALL
jgi:hypothetical protein